MTVETDPAVALYICMYICVVVYVVLDHISHGHLLPLLADIRLC